MSSSVSTLFRPLPVGAINVGHRVVMAPLTRFRANKDHVHGELAKTYYTQRASVPGTLLVTEATFIAPRAGGYANTPGIWSDAQIAGWKVVRTSSRLAMSLVVTDWLFKNRLPTPSTQRDLSFSSSYGPWGVLRALEPSRKKAASMSSAQVPFDMTVPHLAAMKRSFPESLQAQSSKSMSNYTPRRQRTRSRLVLTASSYMRPMATFWTNFYSLYPTTGQTITEDRSKIVCDSRLRSSIPL